MFSNVSPRQRCPSRGILDIEPASFMLPHPKGSTMIFRKDNMRVVAIPSGVRGEDMAEAVSGTVGEDSRRSRIATTVLVLGLLLTIIGASGLFMLSLPRSGT